MRTKLVALSLVGTFLFSGCSSEPKVIGEFYNHLYLEVEPQVDDGYTDAQVSAIETDEEAYKLFSVSYEKANALMQTLKVKASASLDQASDEEKKVLNELISMYDNYARESQNAISLISNFTEECVKRKPGTLPSSACQKVFWNANDMKKSSLVCVYYFSAKLLKNFPDFDDTKVDILNSEMSPDVISDGCEAFRQSASLEGYPYRTDRRALPEKMQREIDSQNVIVLSDGLYMNYVEDVPLLEQAVFGSWFGYCSAFESMKSRMPNRVKSGSCY